MSVYSCSVPSCKNTTSSKRGYNAGEPHCHMYRFPDRRENPEAYAAWEQALMNADEQFVASPSAMICSEHFRDEDMDVSSLLKCRLMSDHRHRAPRLVRQAVPCLKLGPNTRDPETSERKTTAVGEHTFQMEYRKFLENYADVAASS